MEIRVAKAKDGVLLSGAVPQEIATAGTIEIFPLRDGAYLVIAKGLPGRPKAPFGSEGISLTEAERLVVKRLSAIRFENRTVADVNRALSPKERETLEGLLQKKLVSVFKSAKYSEGVYSIADAAYPQPRALSQQHIPATPAEGLEKLGFASVESENEAKALAAAFSERLKTGEVRGLRAFDRRYYFIKRSFAEEWDKKVLLALSKGDKTAEETALAVGLAPEGCLALLLHLCESGEALEKARGKFARA